MATARKEKSGNYRVRVYDYQDINGKQHYKSFTASTKKEAERLAAAYERDQSQTTDITFETAAKEYIDTRRDTLSPRTIEDYDRTLRLYLGSINHFKIDKLTHQDIQRVINDNAKRLSPKTVVNIHSFISAVMKQSRPSFALNTTLPQRTKPNLTIPTDDDVSALLDAVKGTTLELPIMLAAFGPMREGEICALRSENIDGKTVHVCENMVKKVVNGHTAWIIRHPKSTEGDRYIEYPDFVADMWEKKTGRIVEMNPNTLCKSFKRVIDNLDIPSFRFHDLRHYSASIQHAMGIPDAYIMQRGGWSDDRILKSVYRHALDDQIKAMNDKANNYFSDKHDAKHDAKK